MSTPDRGADGFRRTPGDGPAIRSDIIDVYLFRELEDAVEFFQARRATAPFVGDWHPIMGHIESGESAAQCAIREMAEEVGLTLDSPDLLGFWQLEQVRPYFLAELDCIVMSPRFAAKVSPEWTPTLDASHDDFRWISADRIRADFVWPGQKRACQEVLEELVRPGSLAAQRLRIDPNRSP